MACVVLGDERLFLQGVLGVFLGFFQGANTILEASEACYMVTFIYGTRTSNILLRV